MEFIKEILGSIKVLFVAITNFKLYKRWVRIQHFKYEKNKQAPVLEDKPIKKEDNKNDYLEGCLGCGCLIAILWGVCAAISWAWHIHWLFGLFMALFLLGVLR